MTGSIYNTIYMQPPAISHTVLVFACPSSNTSLTYNAPHLIHSVISVHFPDKQCLCCSTTNPRQSYHSWTDYYQFMSCKGMLHLSQINYVQTLPALKLCLCLVLMASCTLCCSTRGWRQQHKARRHGIQFIERAGHRSGCGKWCMCRHGSSWIWLLQKA